MKKCLLMTGFLCAVSALADMPMHIICTGNETMMTLTMTEQLAEDGTMVMEAAMMLNGKEYTQNAVHITSTPMGMMYTITTNYIPDFRTNYMTFVMPPMNIIAGRGEVDFMGTMYSHTQKTSFAGPGIIHGVIGTVTSTTTMECTALDS